MNTALLQRLQQPGPKRILRPGQPMTMDQSGQRVNVVVDAQNRITRITCG